GMRFLGQRQQKLQRSHQMRRLHQQALTFTQRLTHQPDLSMFQITQAAVNNARGPAGGAGGKIILLHQQRALAPLRTLARNRDAVNAAANYQNVKALVFGLNRATHVHHYLDAFSGKNNVTYDRRLEESIDAAKTKLINDLWAHLGKYAVRGAPQFRLDIR